MRLRLAEKALFSASALGRRRYALLTRMTTAPSRLFVGLLPRPVQSSPFSSSPSPLLSLPVVNREQSAGSAPPPRRSRWWQRLFDRASHRRRTREADNVSPRRWGAGAARSATASTAAAAGAVPSSPSLADGEDAEAEPTLDYDDDDDGASAASSGAAAEEQSSNPFTDRIWDTDAQNTMEEIRKVLFPGSQPETSDPTLLQWINDTYVVYAAENILVWAHTDLGLPWWGAIVFYALIVRLFLFPLHYWTKTRYAKRFRVDSLVVAVSRSLPYNNIVTRDQTQAIYKQASQMYGYFGCRGWYAWAIMVVHICVFVPWSLALRNVLGHGSSAYTLPPEAAPLVEGGLGWFTDLQAIDSTWMMPLMCSMLWYANVHFNEMYMEEARLRFAKKMNEPPKPAPLMVRIMFTFQYYYAMLSFPLWASILPMGLYWMYIPSAIFALINSYLTSRETFLKSLGIYKPLPFPEHLLPFIKKAKFHPELFLPGRNTKPLGKDAKQAEAVKDATVSAVVRKATTSSRGSSANKSSVVRRTVAAPQSKKKRRRRPASDETTP